MKLHQFHYILMQGTHRPYHGDDDAGDEPRAIPALLTWLASIPIIRMWLELVRHLAAMLVDVTPIEWTPSSMVDRGRF
jgi:hypothetical protein